VERITDANGMGVAPAFSKGELLDGLDPAFAPGTAEIGGLTVIQGLEIVRGCRGLDVVAAISWKWRPPTTP
jgi:guanidinobutyrase